MDSGFPKGAQPQMESMSLSRAAPMNKHRLGSLIAMFTMLMFTGCDEVVTRYDTLEDAKSRRAFERGWLPPLLPDSSRAIVERNDLDVNIGTGSFDFDESDRSVYLERMSQLGASIHVERDSEVLKVSTNDHRWEIRLPLRSGQATWKVRQP